MGHRILYIPKPPSILKWCFVENMVYDTVSLDVHPKDEYPWAIAFSTDGTKLYVVGYNSDTIYQYTLSTAWDLSTATYTALKSVTSEENEPRGLAFSVDGSKMYVCGTGSDAVKQYTLSTAWDISTASYASKSFPTTTQTTNPYSIFFNPDGTKMYIGAWTATRGVYEYTLSTAWDISTASYTNNSVDPGAATSDIYIRPDGKKLYVIRSISSSLIYQYPLATAWDLGSVGAVESSKDIGANGHADGLFFSSDGAKVYTCDYDSDLVKQYTLCG